MSSVTHLWPLARAGSGERSARIPLNRSAPPPHLLPRCTAARARVASEEAVCDLLAGAIHPSLGRREREKSSVPSVIKEDDLGPTDAFRFPFRHQLS